MKFIDDKNKKLNWYNRNYFYLGSVLFISVCVLIHAFWGSSTPEVSAEENVWNWINFSNLLQGCLNNVFHADWQHVLLNMLCFAVCGLYIERKTGTFNFILLTLATIIFDAAFTAGNVLRVSWIGASGVQYLLYGYIIIDYIFSFQRAKKNKTNTILGAVVLAFIYISMCFNGGTTAFGFDFYPVDLLTNAGHFSPMLAGLLIGLIVQISQLKIIRSATINYEHIVEEKHRRLYKIGYSLALTFVSAMVVMCLVCCPVAANRTEFYVNFVCNYSQYNREYKFNMTDHTTSFHLWSVYRDWVVNDVDFSNKDKYVCQIFTDKEKQKPIVDAYKDPTKFSDSYEFVSLSKSTEYTYYIEISKSFKVENSYPVYATGIYEENTSKSENTTIYSLEQYVSSNVYIKEGDDYKFKLDMIDYYDNDNFKVYNNGVEISKGEDGYYTVFNVRDNIKITYDYIY